MNCRIKNNIFYKLSNFVQIILLIILICSNHLNIFAQTNFKYIDSHSKIHKLKIIAFNSISYISLSELSAILPGENAEISSGVVRTSECELKSANGSIFVLFNNISEPDSQKILQLQTPAILIREEIFIPAVSMFNSMKSSGLIDLTISNGEYLIKLKTISAEKKPFASDNEKNKEVQPGKIDLKPLRSPVSTKKVMIEPDRWLTYDSTSVKSPGKYVLPKGLIRRELEEKKKR